MSADIKRPLIVDEAHHIAAKHFVDVLRELHDKSLAPVILIGEETLPSTLERFERVHNRMLEWLGAEECNIDDARTLVRAYCPSLSVGEELLAVVVQRTGGNTRRIVVAISRIAEAARVAGLQSIGIDTYDIGQITSHRAPAPRSGRAQ
jgi:DNA transposition AAA+ family ATPase